MAPVEQQSRRIVNVPGGPPSEIVVVDAVTLMPGVRAWTETDRKITAAASGTTKANALRNGASPYNFDFIWIELLVRRMRRFWGASTDSIRRISHYPYSGLSTSVRFQSRPSCFL